MGPKDQARKLSKVIEHPIRAKIIELLGQRGSMGWKELSQEVGVKTGALYHHLDALEGLVERDQSKRYALTKSGRIVYSKTSESRSIEAVKEAAIDIQKEGKGRRTALSIFAPRSLLETLTESPRRSTAMLAVLALAFAAYAYLGGTSPVLYFLHRDPGILNTVGGFALSLSAITAIGYASARLAFGSAVEVLPLAAAAAFSFLPVVLFSTIELLPSASALFAASSVVYTLALVFFQSWSAAILGAGLSVASGVRIERTLLVSLLLLYATMVTMLVQGKVL